jgi:DNA primase
VQEFRLGFAPGGWDAFVSFAASKGIKASACAACGLAISRPDGSAYDRFRERIMFPIFDISGRPVAFGGRIVGEGEPKYLNSPESVLYHKNRTLYGLHKSRPFIKEKGYVIIVEGYMDFLGLYQAGITNCVATSGTALTEEHGRIIRRFTSRVVLMFDGDGAGIAAAQRAVFLLAPAGLDVRVLILPDEHDPDTYVLKYGAANLLALVGNAQPGIRFAIDRAIQAHGADTPQGKSLIVNQMAPLAAATSDPIVASEYVRQIAECTGVREQFILDAIRKLKGRPEQKSAQANAPASGTEEFFSSIEGAVVSLLVQHPPLIDTAMERISRETFTDTFSANLYSMIIDAYHFDPSLETMVSRMDDGEEKRILSRMLVDVRPTQDPGAELQHAILRLEAKKLKSRMRAISARLRQEKDSSAKKKLLEEQQSIARRLKELELR